MTQQQIISMIEWNMSRNPNPMIATDAGVKAVKKLSKIAERNDITFALVGGIAMHFYDSPRLTRDVDVIASNVLPIESERDLGFGGKRYLVPIGKLNVPLDWIVRKDDARIIYENALADAYRLSNGLLIVTAEWLVIMKFVAGRFKDQMDAVFLLKQKGLVNRKLIRKKIKETLGPGAWSAFAAGLQRWYDLADGKITNDKEDYEADRL